ECFTNLVNFLDIAPLLAADQRHTWLRYQIAEYTEGIRHSYKQRLKTIWSRPVNQVYVLDFEGLTADIRQDLAVRLRMVYSGRDIRMSDTVMDLDTNDALCFQLGGVRRRMTWRQFILVLGLHTELEMAEAGFGAYWAGSDRSIPDKGDLRDYWLKISSDKDLLGPDPSYVLIRDPVRRLCHRMIAYSISGRGQAPEKVTGEEEWGHAIRRALYWASGYAFWAAREAPHLHEVPERQQAAAASALEADKADQAVEEVALEIPAPAPALAQAPPPPPPAS
ncbi:hypothetical protein Tco_0546115, partial [Tanacetum coccineum]